MKPLVACPICDTIEDSRFAPVDSRETYYCEYAQCGHFEISSEAVHDGVIIYNNSSDPLGRAILSHRVRRRYDGGNNNILLTNDWLETFFKDLPRLPSRIAQANNIVRFVGNHVELTGRTLKSAPVSFASSIGAANQDAALKLVRELISSGLLTGAEAGGYDSPYQTINIDLTLAGWAKFEQMRKGINADSTGFLAMKFGDH